MGGAYYLKGGFHMTDRKKQQRRVMRFIENATKRGFEFDANQISEIISTASLRNLRDLNPSKLYELATYVKQDTGEILSGVEGRKLERREAAYKGILRKKQAKKARASFVDIVIQALNNAIDISGREAVATRLENNAESLSDYLNRSKLFGDSISAIISYCQAMFGDLPGMTNEDVINVSDILDGLESYETT